MAKWRAGAADRLKSREKPINVGRLVDELNLVMPEDAILVADGGFAGHWGGLLFDTKRAGRHFIADSQKIVDRSVSCFADRSPGATT